MSRDQLTANVSYARSDLENSTFIYGADSSVAKADAEKLARAEAELAAAQIPTVTAQMLAQAMRLLAENGDCHETEDGTLVNFGTEVWLCSGDSVSLNELTRVALVCARHKTLPATSIGTLHIAAELIPTKAKLVSGWHPYTTGGGCMAYALDLGLGGPYLLCTNADGDDMPEPVEEWAEFGAPLIGLYNVDGDDLFLGQVVVGGGQ